MKSQIHVIGISIFREFIEEHDLAMFFNGRVPKTSGLDEKITSRAALSEGILCAVTNGVTLLEMGEELSTCVRHTKAAHWASIWIFRVGQ